MGKQFQKRVKDVRRFMLLAVAAAWAVGMLTMMGKGAMVQNVELTEPEPQEQVLSMPCAVKDTQMVAQLLAYYEGPFREDGSDEEVAGVAALVVENAGGTMISEGAVILEWGNDRLVFELYALPAGERALILEKDQKTWREQQLTACYGWERREYPENMGHVSVTDAGAGCMLVTNHTDAAIAVARIRYKSYHEESGMYIGGICYETVVEALAPGEQRIISPYHYLCGTSRVVCVTVEADK